MLYWLAYAGAQGFGGLIGGSFLLSHEPGQDLAVLGGKSLKFIVSTMELAASCRGCESGVSWRLGPNLQRRAAIFRKFGELKRHGKKRLKDVFLARNAPFILAPSNKIHDKHIYEFISMSFLIHHITIQSIHIFYIPSYDAHFDIFCRDASVDIPRFDRSWKMTQQDSGNWRMRWRKLKYDQITQILIIQMFQILLSIGASPEIWIIPNCGLLF